MGDEMPFDEVMKKLMYAWGILMAIFAVLALLDNCNKFLL